MSSTNDPSNKNIVWGAFGAKALTVGGEVGCLTLIIVLGAVFGGLWLDNLFGTKPAITVLFVLASAPIALVLTVWVAKKSVQDYKPGQTTISRNEKSSNQQSISSEGDTDQ
jgi:hypothetical protein